MTKCAHAVISTDVVDDDAFGERILEKVFLEGTDRPQLFEQIAGKGFEDGEYDAGGSLFFVQAVYAAAFNHVPEQEIADWFDALPWRDYDNASLSIYGEDWTVFVSVMDGKVRRVQEAQ